MEIERHDLDTQNNILKKEMALTYFSHLLV